jgi:thiamine-phosphate pyrophosphorylase
MIRGLYAIADVETLARRGVGLREFAEGLRAAGVSVVQLRDKSGSPQAVLAGAEVLREVFRGTGCLLVMNDRVDLGVIGGLGGVLLGQ